MSVTVSGDVITNVLMWLNTWCSECALLQTNRTASVCKPCMLHSLWEFSENDTRRVCVWVWVFPVRPESVCKQTPMSSWAFGLSTTPSQRGNVDLHTHTHTLTSTQTVYAYMHRQAAHHHTQTSINTHIYSTTHSHTNTFPLAPTGDRRCHVYWLAGNFNRREWETSSYHCLSPPDMPPPSPSFFFLFLFLSDVSISTLWSVYLSKATTQQVLLLPKSKSGGGVGDKFPDEQPSGRTQENVNWAWSISDNI